MTAASWVASNGNRYRMTRNLSELNINEIHQCLTNDTYWAPNISLDVVSKAFQNSLCFGVLQVNDKSDRDHSDTPTATENTMVAFARVVTDYATFGYISDVYVKPEYRGCGIGKNLLQGIMADEELKGMRRLMLATKDAHKLYQQAGFSALEYPQFFMEVYRGPTIRPVDEKGGPP
ncbi:MAG: hypothetical protein SGILL_000055 [Bacillariaceae sp.]